MKILQCMEILLCMEILQCLSRNRVIVLRVEIKH